MGLPVKQLKVREATEVLSLLGWQKLEFTEAELTAWMAALFTT
jgi:hypothetical protein